MLPVGPRHIQSIVCSAMELWGLVSSYTLQHAPKGTLQCFLKSNNVCVMIVLGLKIIEQPVFDGMAFIHRMQKLISLIGTWAGRCWNGRVLIIALTLSFINLILHSTSGAWSCAAMMFNASSLNSPLNSSNCWFANPRISSSINEWHKVLPSFGWGVSWRVGSQLWQGWLLLILWWEIIAHSHSWYSSSIIWHCANWWPMDALFPCGRMSNATLIFSNSLDVASAHKVMPFLASRARACSTFRDLYAKLMSLL